MKKIITIFLLLSLFSSTVNKPSYGSFFHRHKKEKKSVAEQNVTKPQEKKVFLVEIYASWCPGCKNIQPTLDQLTKERSDIEMVVLDVSTPSKAKDSAKKAEELKITDFYNVNKSKTSTIAIFVPTSLEIVSVFQNNNDLSEYKIAIEQAKTKEKSLKNPL